MSLHGSIALNGIRFRGYSLKENPQAKSVGSFEHNLPGTKIAKLRRAKVTNKRLPLADPEGSYARASVGTSSELILGANSHVRVGTEPQKTPSRWKKGALAIKNIPEGQYLEIRVEPIDESNATTTSIPFETRKITSVYARVENRRLEVFVIGGELESDRTLFGEKSSLRWEENHLAIQDRPLRFQDGSRIPKFHPPPIDSCQFRWIEQYT